MHVLFNKINNINVIKIKLSTMRTKHIMLCTWPTQNHYSKRNIYIYRYNWVVDRFIVMSWVRSTYVQNNSNNKIRTLFVPTTNISVTMSFVYMRIVMNTSYMGALYVGVLSARYDHRQNNNDDDARVQVLFCWNYFPLNIIQIHYDDRLLSKHKHI